MKEVYQIALLWIGTNILVFFLFGMAAVMVNNILWGFYLVFLREKMKTK